MLCTNFHVVDFWLTPWSDTFRAACLWFTPETQPLRGRKPDKEAPNWVRPLLLQRWVAQAIAARLAANPDTRAYRYGRESNPCYGPVAWGSYQQPILRQASEARLLWLFLQEVECLLRIAQEHPGLVGGTNWTEAALCASEHIAQVYAELRRRHKAMRARALLREELRRFVAWQGDDFARPRGPLSAGVF